MKISNTILWSSLGVAALAVAGCDLFVGGRSRQEPVYVEQQPVYVQQQPVYVQQQPAYVEQQPQYVIVREAPPPVRIERRPEPASSAQIWIDGYWNWDNQRYSWVGGRYQVPPQPDVVWVAPRYDHDAQGYRYTPGTWAKQDRRGGRGRGRG